jgi:hypothetical protein
MIHTRKIKRLCEEILLWISAVALILGSGYVCVIICFFGPLAFPIALVLFLGCFFILSRIMRRLARLYDLDDIDKYR